MDVKRLEDIRDFIINEIDKGIERGKYENKHLNIYYIKYRYFENVDVKIFDCIGYTETIINKVFKDIKIYQIVESEKGNNWIIISISLEQDFKLLNRKRKLWMLKD